MAEPGTLRRIFWFVGLWLAGVLAVGVLGLIIKFWLGG
ncbi:hypothetical protein REJC140_00712 [Pseudorhizobium endolithicum]|uniref:DUF2474 domain-containing protein n=1 Tax=Pseudorhizobium endolithicum TaxID=1191678 RepID=A0ABM8PN96_9HYPH|nr:hypothetical protein REQ54_00168 [Rhizobium sp. Q54]CAD7039117.1 hypothetical protein REJC140_00712 [Pseudorhizobium endolithicum]